MTDRIVKPEDGELLQELTRLFRAWYRAEDSAHSTTMKGLQLLAAFREKAFREGEEMGMSIGQKLEELKAEEKSASDDTALEAFRVWPDHTVQSVDEGEPYSWLGDDYKIVEAVDEEDALCRYTRI